MRKSLAWTSIVEDKRLQQQLTQVQAADALDKQKTAREGAQNGLAWAKAPPDTMPETVESVFPSDGITEEELRAGRYGFAELRMFLVKYPDLSQGILKLRRGWLGEVTIRDGMYVAELRAMTQRTSARAS
jgi:hypothetical protein